MHVTASEWGKMGKVSSSREIVDCYDTANSTNMFYFQIVCYTYAVKFQLAKSGCSSVRYFFLQFSLFQSNLIFFLYLACVVVSAAFVVVQHRLSYRRDVARERQPALLGN